MFRKDLMIPALLGLGLYAQNSDVNLSNNTTMLISLFVLLEDHSRINELEARVHRLEKIEYCERDNRSAYQDEYCYPRSRRYY